MTRVEVLDIDVYQVTPAWENFGNYLFFHAVIVVQKVQRARAWIHGGDETQRVPFPATGNPRDAVPPRFEFLPVTLRIDSCGWATNLPRPPGTSAASAIAPTETGPEVGLALAGEGGVDDGIIRRFGIGRHVRGEVVRYFDAPREQYPANHGGPAVQAAPLEATRRFSNPGRAVPVAASCVSSTQCL